MSENLRGKRCAESPHCVLAHPSLRWILLSAVLAMISVSCAVVVQDLPPGGTTSWQIQEVEAIVTFVIFDPKDPAVALPAGLRFVSAREVELLELQEHLKQHPEHSDWAFSFIEFVRPTAFLLDGKALTLPENEGISVWFAPVDHSQLAADDSTDKVEAVIASSTEGMLGLGFWVPDRDYVAYMRTRGHRAEYGNVALVKDSNGTFQGELQLADLNVKASATPQGEVRSEPGAYMQVLFEPGERVENAVVLAGGNVRERDCTAEWTKKGDHPLSRGVLVGPTYLVVEGPFRGSAYRLGKEKDR